MPEKSEKSLKEILEEIKPFIDRRPKMREYSTAGQWDVSDRVIPKTDYRGWYATS